MNSVENSGYRIPLLQILLFAAVLVLSPPAPLSAQSIIGDEIPLPVLKVRPATLVSRDTCTVLFTLYVQQHHRPGTEFHLEIPVSFTGENRDDMWEFVQASEPDSGGYIWVEAPSSVTAEAFAHKISVIGARLVTGTLSPGDSLNICYRGRIQAAAIPFRFRGRFISPGGSCRHFSAESDTRVIGRNGTLVKAATPADVISGEPFTAVVTVLDDFGNPAFTYGEPVYLSIPGAGEYSAHFCPEDSGRIEFEDIIIDTTGVIYPELHSGGLMAETAPFLVTESSPGKKRLFGDTHFHTGGGNGYRGWVNPGFFYSGGDHRGNYSRQSFAYKYAKEISSLDWVVSSEHDVADIFPGYTGEDWVKSQDKADAVYEPGTFTTFYAWEWTSWLWGHRIVYYKDRGGSVFHRTDENYSTVPDLVEALEGQEVESLIMPHVMQPLPDARIWLTDPIDLQRLVEIYSHHNDDSGVDIPDLFEVEARDLWSLQYAWSVGHRFGVIGSSDDHFGLPGRNGIVPDSEGSGGLAVVIAEENSRDSIWEALVARRTYATTGTRILLDFRVNGHRMGSEIDWEGGSPRIEIKAAGTDTLDRVELVRYSGDEYSQLSFPCPGWKTCDFSVTDQTVNESAMYYVRLVQKDGEMAWSSPVWLDVSGSR